METNVYTHAYRGGSQTSRLTYTAGCFSEFFHVRLYRTVQFRIWSSMITLTGFDYQTFHYLLPSFDRLYRAYTYYSADGALRITDVRGGRPRSMIAVQCLGLVFAWSRARGYGMVLCILFRVTASVFSLFIRFKSRFLLKI